MNVFALSGLINGIFALSFGLVIIFKNWRGLMNRLFFLMTLSVAVWAFSYWQWLSAIDIDAAAFWVQMLSIGSLFIPIFYFHWSITLLNINPKFSYLLHGMYLATVIFLLVSSSPLFIRELRPALFFPFWPRAGIMYTLYLILIYFGLISYAVYLMLRQYNQASSKQKGQIFYILLGSLFGFGGGAMNFFLWYDIPIAPYGNILVALFPFLLGYAVIKHHLFDLRVVATELLVFAIWMFLLVRGMLATTAPDRYFDFGLLGLVVLFGIFLIRTVWREVEQREQIASLAFELSTANTELKKLDAAKSEFISIAGHQLRTPLTVIKGYTSMMLEGSFGKIESRAKEALNRVFMSSVQLAKLVSDLLDLSRIEAGKISYDFKEVFLDDIVLGVTNELEETAREKYIGLVFENRLKGKIPILADFDKMHEVVINLVDNAVKYSQDGDVKITLEEKAKGEKSELLLSVTDHGMGIKPEDISKLFGKFARSEEAKKARPDGMGLGLYLVKKIVEDHKGRFWVESPGLGRGSTFFVELPAS
jgi:signal transduction histidine kinase